MDPKISEILSPAITVRADESSLVAGDYIVTDDLMNRGDGKGGKFKVVEKSSTDVNDGYYTFNDATNTYRLVRVMFDGDTVEVSNISTLVTDSLVDGQVITILGRVTDYDGGGGKFIYYKNSTATADDGIIIAPLSDEGRFIRDGWDGSSFTKVISLAFWPPVGSDWSNAVTQAQLFAGKSYIYVPQGTHSTTLSLTQITGNFFGPGKIKTQESYDSNTPRYRGNKIIRITSPKTDSVSGVNIVTGLDGTFATSDVTEIFVSGDDTAGSPTLSYVGEGNYTIVDQQIPNYTNSYYSSGKNVSPISSGARTGWAPFINRVTHAGKGDAFGRWDFIDISAADSNIQMMHGVPAGGVSGGGVNCLTNDVEAQVTEYTMYDNGYSVSGRGNVLNMVRNNSARVKDQFWVGIRHQSMGTAAVDAGYQAIGSFNAGIDLSMMTGSVGVAMAPGASIVFDSTYDYVKGAPAWTASETVAVGVYRQVDRRIYKSTVAGTTSSTAPTHTSGTATDGTVTWSYDTYHEYKRAYSGNGGTYILKNGNYLNFVFNNTIALQLTDNYIFAINHTLATKHVTMNVVTANTQYFFPDIKTSIILVDATSQDMYVYLPLANSYGAGQSPKLTVKRIDAGTAHNVYISHNGSDKIDGVDVLTLTASQSKTLICDGSTKWYSI